MLKLEVAVLSGVLVAFASTAQAQDAAAGKRVFSRCMVCHSIGPGATNKVGPELNGLLGRHSGSVPGYSYSDANKNSGIVWTEDEFAKYIKNPRALVPGTKMVFPGIQDDKQIADLTAYLKTFNADGGTQ
jgi:cytochrome c